jgi:hypothetical protein
MPWLLRRPKPAPAQAGDTFHVGTLKGVGRVYRQTVIDTRAKTQSPRTNGIRERFHRTVLDEFYRVAFRKKIDRTIDKLQTDLDTWIAEYNEKRPHQGRWCFGKTPMQTFLDALPWVSEKLMAA